jgi:hypothetical protein
MWNAAWLMDYVGKEQHEKDAESQSASFGDMPTIRFPSFSISFGPIFKIDNLEITA